MKIIDRYLLGEFLRYLLLITASFVALFLIIDFFEKTRMFLSNNATVGQMAAHFLFRVPMIVSQVLPAAVLLASLILFGTLARHSEITAMKANGLGLHRVALPVFLLAAAVCALVFLLSEWVTPYTNERAEYIRLVEVQKQKSLGSFKQDQIWYRGQKGIYNFRLFDAERGVIRGITIYRVDQQMNLLSRLDAERGEWKDNRWRLTNTLTTSFQDGTFPTMTKAATLEADIPETPEDFKVVQKDVETMGYAELKQYIEKLQSEGYDATRYIVDLHGKIAFSLVSLILAVIGICFSLRSERSGGIAQGIGAGLVIGFSYWLVFAFGMSLGRSGTLPPVLAAWFANILFGLASLALLSRMKT